MTSVSLLLALLLALFCKATQVEALRARARATTPPAAFATSYNLSGGSLPVYQSVHPEDESTATSVYIVTHGVDRNYGDYFEYLTAALNSGKSQGLPYASARTLRVSLLFQIDSDSTDGYPSDTLQYSDDNGWCAGDSSVKPKGSDMSSLAVYDELVQKYSDKSAYPNVQLITFLGHGCGGILAQRYAAVGLVPSNGVEVRFIVGDPSTMVYWTKDRPVKFNKTSCDYYNSWYYGLDDFYINYAPWDGKASTGFSTYAGRDVRYLIAMDDTSANGDQGCEAQAQGGVARRDRSLAYYKYIHLLTGDDETASTYPGNFNVSVVTGHSQFHGVTVQHKMYKVTGVGHDAAAVLGSAKGVNALFSD